ncbi:MAG: MlaD family protein [Myxococcota bacterium]
MADQQRQNYRVGLFVALLFAAMGVTTFLVSGSSDLFNDRYTIYAAWKDVAGLKEGAVVRLAGWDVGEVTSIYFSDDPNKQEIYVVMRIMTDYQDRIRHCPAYSREDQVRLEQPDEDGNSVLVEPPQSKARIETMGVLGDKYVALTMGPTHDGRLKSDALPLGADCPVLEDGDWIGTEEAIDVVEYTKKVTEILNSTSNIGRKVDLMLGADQEAARTSLANSLSHFEDMLREVKEGDGVLHTLIYEKQTADQIKSLLASLNRAGRRLDDVGREIQEGDGIANELIYGDGGKDLVDDLDALAASLTGLTEDIKSEASLINTLIYDEEKTQIIDDLASTAAALKETSAMLQDGDGTLAMLARDPALYEDMRTLVRGAQRNKLLRAYIRQTIERADTEQSSAWEPLE